MTMMGYGYGPGNGWMWGFGGLLMLILMALIGLAVWFAISNANRQQISANIATAPTSDVAGRERTRQLLDDRYARGDLTTEEYTERLRTLGF